MPEMLNTQQDQRPVPDPTLLTSQLVRESELRIEKTIGLQFAAMALEMQGVRKLADAHFDALDDRYELQTRALDAAFTAQTTAMDAAFAASEKAVTSAMSAADEALGKSVLLTDAKLASHAETMTSLREMLNERYQTQTKALDAAFVAQQAAVATSFDASEKAMAAALLAAKEAVDKAAVSTEKRFDSVTELLAQLNAANSALLPRSEAEARMADLDRRVTDIKSTVDKGFTGTDTRSAAGKEYWGYMVGAVGLLIAIVVPIIVVLVNR